MLGYRVSYCPAKTDNPDLLATVYVKHDKALIAIASWAPEPVNCRLRFDWDYLGLPAETARLSAPYIEQFQDSATFAPTDPIPVEPGKGWLLVLSS